jgi:hypothetical protein
MPHKLNKFYIRTHFCTMTTAADLKQQLAELADRRSHLEQDVSLARARLEATGLGMDELLVDSEVRRTYFNYF